MSDDLRALLGDKWTSKFVEAGPDECWPWTACINKRNGYGQMAVKTDAGRWVNRAAHRIAYEIHYGPVPDGCQVDHMCHRRECVNPGHLRAVSASATARNRAGANANSASGARGVWWHGEQGRWVAQVGRLRQAGFETKTEAEAYVMGAHAALGWVTTTGGQP